MKSLILSFQFLVLCLVFGFSTSVLAERSMILDLQPPADNSVKVTDQEAILLFRYVGGEFANLPEDETHQILHSELMMCSILFAGGGVGPKVARCMLPHEQIKFEKDNAVEVTQMMKKYRMPSHFKFGYETVEAGLDCISALSGDEFPVCYLTPRTSN